MPIHTSRSPIGLHLLEGLQTSRFAMSNGFASATRLLLLPVGLKPRLNNATPLVQSHYRTFIPTTGCSVPVFRIGTLILVDLATWMSPFTSERQVLTFLTKAWLGFAPPTRRMPLGQPSGQLPNSSREKGQPPVSTSSNLLSTLLQRFACARLSRSYLPGSCPDVSATLPGRPAEFHRQPPTDPDLTLSRHPARATG